MFKDYFIQVDFIIRTFVILKIKYKFKNKNKWLQDFIKYLKR